MKVNTIILPMILSKCQVILSIIISTRKKTMIRISKHEFLTKVNHCHRSLWSREGDCIIIEFLFTHIIKRVFILYNVLSNV